MLVPGREFWAQFEIAVVMCGANDVDGENGRGSLRDRDGPEGPSQSPATSIEKSSSARQVARLQALTDRKSTQQNNWLYFREIDNSGLN